MKPRPRDARRRAAACRRGARAARRLRLKDKDVDPPAELADFKPTIAGGASSGAPASAAVSEKLRLGLRPRASTASASSPPATTATSRAFDANTGKRLWRTETKLAALRRPGRRRGPGRGRRERRRRGRARCRRPAPALAVDASTARSSRRPPSRAAVVVCARSTGACAASTPPTASEAGGPSSRCRGCRCAAPARRWSRGDVVVCGFDNGRVVACRSATATPSGKRRSAPPRGRTELERLVDIDSAVRVAGDDIYVVGFQGSVAHARARNRPGVVVARHVQLPRPRLDDDELYVSTPRASVVALGRRTGVECGSRMPEAPRLSARRRCMAARSRSPTSRATCTGSTAAPARCVGARAAGRRRASRRRRSWRATTCSWMTTSGKLARVPAASADGGAAEPMLPVVALVGRPNVGKSTLFNALTRHARRARRRRAGLTRDRQYGYARLGGAPLHRRSTPAAWSRRPHGVERLMREQTDAPSTRPTGAVRGRWPRRADRRTTSTSRDCCAAPASRWCWPSTRPRASTRRWPPRIPPARASASRCRSRRRTARALDDADGARAGGPREPPAERTPRRRSRPIASASPSSAGPTSASPR